jgi:hypothetical protein
MIYGEPEAYEQLSILHFQKTSQMPENEVLLIDLTRLFSPSAQTTNLIRVRIGSGWAPVAARLPALFC